MTTQNPDPNNSENLNEDPPFFEVSEKTEKTAINSNLVSPKITVNPEEKSLLTDEPGRIKVLLLAHKSVWIIILVILILIYPVYAVLNKYVLTTPEPENFLIDPSTIKNPENEISGEKNSTQTPSEWQVRFFGSEKCLQIEQCGDTADPHNDGICNLKYY